METQRERGRRLRKLRAPGPRFLVDEITVELLAAAGHDPVEVLRRFTEDHQLTLPGAGDDAPPIYLHAAKGRVTSHQRLDRHSYWSGNGIGLEGSKRKVAKAKAGLFVAAITDHPAMMGKTIVSVERHTADRCVVALDEAVLSFDAEKGTLTQTFP